MQPLKSQLAGKLVIEYPTLTVLLPGDESSYDVITQEELQEFVKTYLRSSRTPEHFEFKAELPYNETGKLLRRVIREL